MSCVEFLLLSKPVATLLGIDAMEVAKIKQTGKELSFIKLYMCQGRFTFVTSSKSSNITEDMNVIALFLRYISQHLKHTKKSSSLKL